MYSARNSWENFNYPVTDENSAYYSVEQNKAMPNNCYVKCNENNNMVASSSELYRDPLLSFTPVYEQHANVNNGFPMHNNELINNHNSIRVPSAPPLRHHPYQQDRCVPQRKQPDTFHPQQYQIVTPTAPPTLLPSQSHHIQHQPLPQYPQHQVPPQPFVMQAYPPQTRQQVAPRFYNPNEASVASGPCMPPAIGVPMAPCQGNPPWSYAYCYGYAYNDQEPCQYSQFVDIEDFMNNEKRKEKSRDAARCRRSRETEIFSELAQVLPLTKEVVNQLDKASIMRMAIAYLKIRGMLSLFPKIQQQLNGDGKPETDNSKGHNANAVVTKRENQEKFDLLNCAEASQLIKQTLDGFLLILSNDGDISYVSDNITDYLGLAKIDVLGQQIWEYSHQCDHAELREALNIKQNGLADKVKDENLLEEGVSTDHRDLFVRFKCTLTSRGRSINIKSASYKVIHITGHLVVDAQGNRVLIAVGRPVPHPSNIEIPLGSTTFLTKHTLDMKFTYVDDKMKNLLDYSPEDLLDKSIYDYYHGADSDNLMSTFKMVLSKGQGETCRYRFLGKYGGYCWIVTQATIVYDKLKPQSVVCVNYVISNLENNNEICSLAQYEASQQQRKENSVDSGKQNASDNIQCDDEQKPKLIEAKVKQHQREQEALITSTNNIRATGTNQTNNQTNQTLNPNSCKNKEITKISVHSVNDETTGNDVNAKTNTNIKIFDVINSTNNSINVIKRENLPIAPTPTATIPLPTTTDLTTTNSADKSVDEQKQLTIVSNKKSNIVGREREQSLSPLRRKLQSNCEIGGTTYKATSQQNQSSVSAPTSTSPSVNFTKDAAEKRPKSVTASVFRTKPAFLNDTTKNFINSLHNSNNSNSINSNSFQLSTAQLNIAPRAQSVTASVFTPKSKLCNINNSPNNNNNSNNNNKTSQQILRTKTSTAGIFSQQHQQTARPAQQQDMNKGFLSFADDVTELAMLKEEPDDLTHLVPIAAVDSCLRVDEATPLFGSDLLLGLMSSYGSLLPEDINSLDSATSSTAATVAVTATGAASGSVVSPCPPTATDGSSITVPLVGDVGMGDRSLISPVNASSVLSGSSNGSGNNATEVPMATSVDGSNSNNGALIDPFINYREESNDTNCSQHLLSPSVTSKSPGGSSLPSLCSPHSLSQEDEFAFMTMTVDDDDIDLAMRAPYIPMNEQDDLPLLTADDLMWCSNNTFITEEFNMHKDTDGGMQQLQFAAQQQDGGCDAQKRNMLGYANGQYGQLHLNQQHFSNSLCSSPASTVSSLSPSPESHHHHNQRQHNQQQHSQQQHQQQQHQMQQDSGTGVFGSDSSELAALLCGVGTGTLTILGGNGCVINDDNDNSSGIGSIGEATLSPLQSQQSPQTHYVPINGSPSGDFRLRQLQQQFQDMEQQQQRQQQQLVGLEIDCKKEKFENSLASSLCDPTQDTFENVYCKDSANLDWNELLQINVNDNSSSIASPAPTTPSSPMASKQSTTLTLQQLEDLQQSECSKELQQLQHEQQEQNIILNALPVITLQNGKSIVLQPEQSAASELILKDDMLTSKGNKIATIRILNGTTAATLDSVNNSGTTIHIVDSKGSSIQQQPSIKRQTTAKVTILQQQQQQQHGSKRHLSSAIVASQVDNKRLKSTNNGGGAISSNSSEASSMPATQLLQQLMAAPVTIAKSQQQVESSAQTKQQQRKSNTANQRCSSTGNNNNNSNSNTAGGKIKTGDNNLATTIQQKQQQQQQQQQQSNSVLKNLLISGCDDELDEDVMQQDDTCSALPPPLTALSITPPLTKPLHCLTSPTSVLRNSHNNPMIGGPGVLPSPTFCASPIEDSHPPHLVAVCDTDSGNDSGIDEIMPTSGSPFQVSPCEPKRIGNGNFFGARNVTNSVFIPIATAPPLNSGEMVGTGTTDIGLNTGLERKTPSVRKTSISYMDGNNPLLTPFLMDLCNDDYNMNNEDQFLPGNDIERVLSEWTHDMS